MLDFVKPYISLKRLSPTSVNKGSALSASQVPVEEGSYLRVGVEPVL